MRFRYAIYTIVITVLFYLAYRIEFRRRANYHASTMVHHVSSSLAARHLPKKGRLFCWVGTSPKYYKTRVLAVNETWLPRCDHGEFFTAQPIGDESIPYSTVFNEMGDGYTELFYKSRYAFYHIYTQISSEFDWYFKADDDTYVMMENLLNLLEKYNSSEPHFLGYTFSTHLPHGFQSGGAGYILSNAAVKQFVEKAYHDQSNCYYDSGEDVGMSRCLANIGIFAEDTRNELGQHRFSPLSAIDFFNDDDDDSVSLMWPLKKKYEAFAKDMVSIHYTSPDEMRIFDILRYRTNGPASFKKQDTSYEKDKNHLK